MPFWSDSSKGENYKAKVEQKMCVAKETPEPSFDIAECNLSEVPPGVYSMCRVFLKETLLLQNNQLQSLQAGGPMRDLSHLLVLNLNNNKLSNLPDDIGCLSRMQELYLENNRLRKLPGSFVNLIKLRHLNLKGNRLREFPSVLCSLPCLEVLNICDNKKINTLPNELCHVVQLKSLQLDPCNFVYPPNATCLDGTECIMKFLCNACGKEYNPVTDSSTFSLNVADDNSDSSISSESPWANTDLSASYQQYQRAKEQKRQELILMEEALKENDVMQAEVAADAATRRQKLLAEFAQEQERFETEIMDVQNRKEKEKMNLLSVMTNIENHSAKLIEQLMCLNEKNKNLEGLLEVLEQDRVENEEMFSIKQEELEQLRKKEILEAMTEMLQAEERQRKYESGKLSIIDELQNNENESNLRVLDALNEREHDQQILINELLEEELYQKKAFKGLQLQKDMRHQEITLQINLIEKELSSLTLAEIRKKNMKVNSDINVLAEHRTALAYLLAELLSAKEKREVELKDQLQQMEHQRLNEMKDFWLIQYQKLLDRKPKELVNAELSMDPFVKAVLIEAGAADFLTLFASKGITWAELLTFTHKDLKKIGLLDEDICLTILSKTREQFHHLKEDGGLEEHIPQEKLSPASDELSDDIPEPSAPEEATAPPISPETEVKLWCQTECVICLDNKSTAVFLPCGHVCCCQSCSSTVDSCPLCRSLISSKFVLTFSS